MGRAYAETMFSESAKRLQARHGARAQYQRLANSGESGDALGPIKRQVHRTAGPNLYRICDGGWVAVCAALGRPEGISAVLDDTMLAFANFAGPSNTSRRGIWIQMTGLRRS